MAHNNLPLLFASSYMSSEKAWSHQPCVPTDTHPSTQGPVLAVWCKSGAASSARGQIAILLMRAHSGPVYSQGFKLSICRDKKKWFRGTGTVVAQWVGSGAERGAAASLWRDSSVFQPWRKNIC